MKGRAFVRRGNWSVAGVIVAVSLTSYVSETALGKPPYRREFFTAYSQAVGTRLDLRLDMTQHCGVCHYDFNGGGPRNPYGLAVEGTNKSAAAILALGGLDSDGDGYSSDTEILNPGGVYSNTPTFPGLTIANVNQTSHIPLSELMDYLTPLVDLDTEPPQVEITYPAGGQSLASSSLQTITWIATDNSGVVAAIDVFVTFDDGANFDPLALGMSNTGSLSWFVQNRPTGVARIRVEALDAAGNLGADEGGNFAIYSSATGRVPTTLRDFDMPGSQPLDVLPLNDPASCRSCHGDYNALVEPHFNWRGSLMANASIDPLFRAALDVANADAPESGDLCLRCHLSAGWLGGRSTPTNGAAMLAADHTGVSCDLCHRMLDPIYEPGVSPPEDLDILAGLRDPPTTFTLGQFVVDPLGTRRGPFSDALPVHSVIPSPFHREAALCGTCHDVSNPVFVRNPDGTYSPNTFDEPAAHFGSHQIGAVERTYSEWLLSAFNSPQGIYAPEFGGNKLFVSTCQDCHMRDVTGKGCNDPAAITRNDLPLHDMTGGSVWLPGVLDQIDPNVDVAALQAGAARASYMLQHAADVHLTQVRDRLRVKVTNKAGHKLPTGYPEGRRMWINVKFLDAGANLLAESGAYDFDTAELLDDAQIKVYEAMPVIGENIAAVVGLPAGTEFHFVLNNDVLKDNRIPPLGFTNAAFEAVGAAPVGASYDDGQNYDVTIYRIPPDAAHVTVTLYYQSTSREFVEFLRDNGIPGGAGDALYQLWLNNGKCPPEEMTVATLPLSASTNDGAESAVAAESVRRVP